MNRWILQYNIQYIKGKNNVVADSLSRPVLAIQRSSEATRLGKSREEIRMLQEEEERWKDLITYLESEKVPSKNYKRTTLDQFTLCDGILHYSITKKDGSIHFCLVVPQSLQKSALHHAYTNLDT